MGIFTILNSFINNIQVNNDTTKGNSNSTKKAESENGTLFPTSEYLSEAGVLSENDEKDALSYLNGALDELEQSENAADTDETTQKITYSQEYALLNDKYNLNIDFSKGITEEQFELIEQAYFLEQQQNNLQEAQENMLDYFETLGEMDKLHDGLKDLAGFGLTKEKIEWYYNDEKAKNDLLTSIIQNGGSIPLDNNTRELIAQYADEGYDCINEIDEISFDLVYEIIKGVKYNPELISSVMASQDSYAIVAQEQQDAVEFELAMAGSTPEQALEYFNKMAEKSQGKITGEELFNNYYKEMFEKYPDRMSFKDSSGIGCNGIEIKDGYLYQELTFPEGYNSEDVELLAQSEFLYKKIDEDGNEKYYKVVNLEDEHEVLSNAFGDDDKYQISNFAHRKDDPAYNNHPFAMFFKANDAIRDNNLYLDKTKQEYNEQFGKKEDGTIENVFDTILEEYPKMYEEAFGQNTLYNKLTEYERDMDSYSGKLSQTLSIACFAASFIPGVHIAASLPLFAAGLDNTIDLVNLATNKKDGEIGTWAGNTLLEAGMMAIGMGINRFASNSANKFVADKIAKGSQFVLNHARGAEALVEYAIDNAASVVWDLGKGLLDGSLANEDGSFNISALKQMIVSDLIFNTADLRNGMALYKALNAGNAVDIGNGVKFQIDDSTGNVKYIYENGNEVTINSNKKSLYDSATNRTYELAYDKGTASYDQGTKIDIKTGQLEIADNYITDNIKTGSALKQQTPTDDVYFASDGRPYSSEAYAKYADELGISRYPTEKEAKIAEEHLSGNEAKTQSAPKQQTSSDGLYSTEEYAKYADEPGISRYPTEKEAKIASNDTETEIKFDSKTKSWQTTGSEKTTATAFSDTESAVKSANTRIDNVALDSNASPILIKAPEGFESKYYKMMQDSEFVERLNEYDYNERQRMLTFYKESDLRKAGLITIDEDPTGGLGEFRYSSNEILNPKYVEKIDKLHNAFITGNYEEAYCPKFNSVDNALDNIKTGDVFQVEGDDYISIKLSDGNAEQLHISADTYFKLFNPADELSISQGQNGDCYFISGVDALYNEPTTRAAVLRSFEEIGSGIINVKLRCEDGSILVNTYDSTDITPFLTKNNDVAIGPKGLQMLEDAQGYARMAESSEYQDLTLDEIDSMYESKKESLGLDEADKFLRIVNRIAGKEYDFENNPIESAVEIREAGGMTETAMRFGLKCDRYGLDGDIQVKDVIGWLKTSSESDWKNIVFSAGSVGTSDEYLINRKNGIVGQHAYQFLPFKTVDSEVKVQVINPHDTRYAKIISLEDFEKDFKRIDLTSGS